MINPLTPQPLGAQHANTTRERVPEVPAGAPLIGQLGSYIGTEPGVELAMRCRRCPAEYRGDGIMVHTQLRAHHAELHPASPVEVSKPASKPALPRARRSAQPTPTVGMPPEPCRGPDCSRLVEHDPHGRHPRRHYCSPLCRTRAKRKRAAVPPAPKVACTVLLTGPRSGARRGQPCGRLSSQALCPSHRQVQRRQAAARYTAKKAGR